MLRINLQEVLKGSAGRRIMESYLVKAKKLKPLWERLGFGSQKKHVAKSEEI